MFQAKLLYAIVKQIRTSCATHMPFKSCYDVSDFVDCIFFEQHEHFLEKKPTELILCVVLSHCTSLCGQYLSHHDDLFFDAIDQIDADDKCEFYNCFEGFVPFLVDRLNSSQSKSEVYASCSALFLRAAEDTKIRYEVDEEWMDNTHFDPCMEYDMGHAITVLIGVSNVMTSNQLDRLKQIMLDYLGSIFKHKLYPKLYREDDEVYPYDPNLESMWNSGVFVHILYLHKRHPSLGIIPEKFLKSLILYIMDARMFDWGQTFEWLLYSLITHRRCLTSGATETVLHHLELYKNEIEEWEDQLDECDYEDSSESDSENERPVSHTKLTRTRVLTNTVELAKKKLSRASMAWIHIRFKVCVLGRLSLMRLESAKNLYAPDGPEAKQAISRARYVSTRTEPMQLA